MALMMPPLQELLHNMGLYHGSRDEVDGRLCECEDRCPNGNCCSSADRCHSVSGGRIGCRAAQHAAGVSARQALHLERHAGRQASCTP